MKKLLTAIVLIAFALISTPAFAGPRDEAIALAEKAAAHVKTVGVEKAMADFNNKEGEFVYGAFYVWSNDFDGVITAHPIKPSLMGKNVYKMKDSNGVQLFKEFIDVAKSKGKGWVNYVWPHPVTKKMANKSSYVIDAGSNLLVGVGIYVD